MHEVLVNRLGGLSLPRKSVVRLTDRPDMTLDVYRGRKTTIQQYNNNVHHLTYLIVYLASLSNSPAKNVSKQLSFFVTHHLTILVVLYLIMDENIFKTSIIFHH